MSRIWSWQPTDAVVAVTQKLYSKDIVLLRGFVEIAEQVVQSFHQFFNWQSHRQTRKIDNVSVQDTHVSVTLNVKVPKNKKIILRYCFWKFIYSARNNKFYFTRVAF